MNARTTLLGLTLTFLLPAVSVAQDWSLQPDPPASSTTWPTDPRPMLRTWRWPESFLLADQDGPFAAVGGWNSPWTIYDLRTGKVVGGVESKVIKQGAVLSRDGTRLAGIVEAGLSQFAAVVADTATGTVVSRIPLRSRPFDFGFAGLDRVVELFRITAPEKECGVKFLDVATATEGTLIPGKVHLAPVVSPGGRYVALATKERITVLSAADDNVAARLALPPVSGSKDRYVPVALAFSPDGTKLGGVFGAPIVGQRVFWWHLDSGTLAGGYRFTRPVVEGQNFEWSVDGTALMLGHDVVLDAESGQELWKLPPTKTTGELPRRLLTANRVLLIETSPKDTSEHRLIIHTRP